MGPMGLMGLMPGAGRAPTPPPTPPAHRAPHRRGARCARGVRGAPVGCAVRPWGAQCGRGVRGAAAGCAVRPWGVPCGRGGARSARRRTRGARRGARQPHRPPLQRTTHPIDGVRGTPAGCAVRPRGAQCRRGVRSAAAACAVPPWGAQCRRGVRRAAVRPWGCAVRAAPNTRSPARGARQPTAHPSGTPRTPSTGCAVRPWGAQCARGGVQVSGSLRPPTYGKRSPILRRIGDRRRIEGQRAGFIPRS